MGIVCAVGFIVLLLIGVAVVTLGSPDADDSQPGRTITYATPPTGTSGDLQFDVLKVETGAKKVKGQTASGEFVTITVKVTNVGTAAARFDPDSPYIFDAQEHMYSADSRLTGRIDVELNPGMSTTKSVYYDAPPGTVPVTFSGSAGFGVPFVRIALPAAG